MDLQDTGTTLQVDKLVYGGEGLARLDGQVVLLPYVLPGEEVAAETQRVKTGLLRGTAKQVLQPSPDRVIPGCNYFGVCGGCHYQHGSYHFQVNAKRNILQETLQRLGDYTHEGEIAAITGEPWQYRNRIQLHVARGQLGYHRPGSHEICPVDHCPISSPMLNQALSKLAKAVQEREWPSFLRTFELFTNETDLQLTITDSTKPVAARFFEWCATFLPGFAGGSVVYGAAGHHYRIGRGSFFQVNRFLIDSLVQEAVSDAEGGSAIDLYAGVGLFTLPMSDRFEKVTAVERGGAASRDLEWNTREQQDRVEVVKSTTEDYLRSLERAPDFIVVDPPRAGLGKEATAELVRLRAPKLCIVSCDPATLARDLKVLRAAYEIERLTMVDLFPQTYHFETVAKLRLRD